MGLGISKLDAVNMILDTNRIKRVTALSSSGTWPSKSYNRDEAGQAEYILDIIARSVQARGIGCNTRRSQAFATSGSNQIVLPDTILRIIPAGPTQRRDHTIRGNKVFDLENNTYTLAGGTYYYDVIEAIDFDDLEPLAKEAIMAEARQHFQRGQRGDPIQDAFTTDSRNRADAMLPRPSHAPNAAPINALPLMSNSPAMGGRDS